MASLASRYSINGLVDTTRSVMENLTNLCNSCGTWLTYDSTVGKWSVVINQPGTSAWSFTDSNIIGAIEVSGTGIRDFYNEVKVTFPRSDIRDQTDFVNIKLTSAERNPNEIDNPLNINYDLVTNPVQAELLGFIELKQSRLDRSIRFQTDWTSLGIRAGDIIDVTAVNYGFDQELFRVISVSEVTGDSGGIVLDIAAMGYNESVYDEDFTLYERSTSTGIVGIGSIGQPVAPQVTKFEVDSKPRLVIEATVPTGLVEGIEYWISGDDTDYSLAATQASTNGGVFATSEVVIAEVTNNIPTGNVYVKVRAVNTTTSSAYSDVASLVYAPVQVPDAINENTDVVDEEGDSLLGLLGLNALLALLKNVLEDGDADPLNLAFGNAEVLTGLDIGKFSYSAAQTLSVLNAVGNTYTTQNGYDPTAQNNNLFEWVIPIDRQVQLLTMTMQSPTLIYQYEVQDRTGTIITNAINGQATVYCVFSYAATVEDVGTVNEVGIEASFVDWNGQAAIFNYNDAPAGYWIVRASLQPTYDLNLNWTRTGFGETNLIYSFNFQNVQKPASLTVQLTGYDANV